MGVTIEAWIGFIALLQAFAALLGSISAAIAAIGLKTSFATKFLTTGVAMTNQAHTGEALMVFQVSRILAEHLMHPLSRNSNLAGSLSHSSTPAT